MEMQGPLQLSLRNRLIFIHKKLLNFLRLAVWILLSCFVTVEAHAQTLTTDETDDDAAPPAATAPTPAPRRLTQEQYKAAIAERERLAQALFDEGVAAAQQDDFQTALTTFENIAQRFGKGDSPTVRILIAKALLSKGEILASQGKVRAAISAWDRIDRRFGQDQDLAIRVVVASTLVTKAEALYKLGEPRMAVTTYEQLSRRFGNDDDGFIRQLVDITKWRIAEILANNEALSSHP